MAEPPNPLAPNSPEREHRIRERAYHLWEAEGKPHGRETEYWERAEELTGMEEHPHAAELPNPASQPGADPNRTQPVEESFIQENLGEFPDRFSDQGDRQLTPKKRSKTGP